MLIISTWLWGSKFDVADVAKLAAGVRRNLKQPHKFVVVTDRAHGDWPDGVKSLGIPDPQLLQAKGCFARLRSFNPLFQENFEIVTGAELDRLVQIDLDTVITGPLDPLFDRPEPFVIMQGGNASNPCKFNGALQMLRAGAHPEVWTDFSLDAARKVPFFEFPDDQGWLWHKLPRAAGWMCGVESGVFVFHKPGWPGWERVDDKIKTGGDGLPEGARLVTFSGWRNPKRFEYLGWVKDNWVI